MHEDFFYNMFAANTDKLANIFLLLISSFLIRQSIIYLRQNWIKTKSHTITIFLLPIITHVITSVISNNIALSLGMVGALSIVRFRNPVKSSFELVVYFLLITLGITASTNFKWLILLVLVSVSIIIGIEILNKFFYYVKKKNLFIFSFSESNNLSILEVSSEKPIDFLKYNEFLISFVEEKNFYNYRFSSDDPNELLKLSHEIKKKILDVKVHYSKS